MEISKRQFFIHKGLTKFYELVALWSESAHVGVLVKRWGKNETSVVQGYGQSLISEYPSVAQLLGAFNAEADTRDKRDYKPANMKWHLVDKSLDFSDLTVSDIENHYLGTLPTKVKVSERILNALEMSKDVEIVSETPGPKAPAPQYEKWGEW